MLRRLSLGASILVCLSLRGNAMAQAGPSPGSNPVRRRRPPRPPERQRSSFNPRRPVAPLTDRVRTLDERAQQGLAVELTHPHRQRNGRLRFEHRSGSGAGVVYGSKGATGVIGLQRAGATQVPRSTSCARGTRSGLVQLLLLEPVGLAEGLELQPQVVNPHWIYPGDQLRMRDPNDPLSQRRETLADASTLNENGKRGLAPSTVFLRATGFLGDPKRDVWGEVAGAVEDQMLLSDGNTCT